MTQLSFSKSGRYLRIKAADDKKTYLYKMDTLWDLSTVQLVTNFFSLFVCRHLIKWKQWRPMEDKT